MRYGLALLFVCAGGLAEAAQPTLTQHTYAAAVASESVVSVTMSAGDAVVIIYGKRSTSNRTVTVTDDSGSNSYPLLVGTGNCAADRCVDVYADFSVSAGTFNITIDQSGTFSSYVYWILTYDCGTSCGQGASSFFSDVSSGTSHYASADATVIDTSTDSTLVSGCVTSANLGTATPATGWEALTESDTTIFGQFEDDLATAFTDERGAWSSTNAVISHCVIFAIHDTGGGGGAGAGGIPHLTLIGAGL